MAIYPTHKSFLFAAAAAVCAVLGAYNASAQDTGSREPPATLEPVPSEPEAGQIQPYQVEPNEQQERPDAKGGARAKAPQPDKPYHLRIMDDPPRSPRQTADTLANLYALLATSTDRKTGEDIAGVIERLWLFGHGDTVFVLMQRANKALAEKNDDLALKLLDAVVTLAPDYTEGWHQRAVVFYTRNNFKRALGDIRRVLALDPNHYKALEGLSRMLEETDQKTGALAAHRQLMEVHPFWPGAEERLRILKRDTEGQGI